MTLSVTDRGELDKIIEKSLPSIPLRIHTTRTILFKQLMIKSERDFVLGLAIGDIMRDFSTVFSQNNHRVMTNEEAMEANQVLIRRSREIDEAIRGAHA